MSVKENYELARKIYAGIGVDTDKAIETLKRFRFPCTAGRATM